MGSKNVAIRRRRILVALVAVVVLFGSGLIAGYATSPNAVSNRISVTAAGVETFLSGTEQDKEFDGEPRYCAIWTDEYGNYGPEGAEYIGVPNKIRNNNDFGVIAMVSVTLLTEPKTSDHLTTVLDVAGSDYGGNAYGSNVVDGLMLPNTIGLGRGVPCNELPLRFELEVMKCVDCSSRNPVPQECMTGSCPMLSEKFGR